MKNIFSELEELGFEDIDNLQIYTVKKNIGKKEKAKNDLYESLLYHKTIDCPVCNYRFKQLALKSTSYRMISKDSDFFIRYDLINPYFYDVYICESCGYSALKSDFYKIMTIQKDLILKNVTSKFKPRTYPDKYTLEIAIERYKMALLNAVFMNAKPSQKAMICLKLSWMYRLGNSDYYSEMERTFLNFALEGFNDAYYNEALPLYGMDKFVMMYLIGELNRRLLNYNTALVWFSQVLTAPNVKQSLKELVRTQRDLIREAELIKTKLEKTSDIIDDNFNFDSKDQKAHIQEANIKEDKSKRIFSKIFNSKNRD
ncbi:DUF2225 domain-containing protein [Clostridium sp. UBA6640]|uniref:DUF2225 domain-containing protein n=1 Tax=Clostridium sp. UBA6640 TaxID=1946370 RepID=UPI0025B92756|nr:DUF2225 domain-containing protein [Clostridium sp. UBA6640]